MCFDDRDIDKVKEPIMLYKIGGVFRIGYDCLVTVAMLACNLYSIYKHDYNIVSTDLLVLFIY